MMFQSVTIFKSSGVQKLRHFKKYLIRNSGFQKFKGLEVRELKSSVVQEFWSSLVHEFMSS